MNAHRAAHRNARSLRRRQTDAERRLWARLRGKEFSGVKFRRQHAIGPYITDFCSPALRLVVELDGGQHAEQTRADEYRTQYLEQRGYRVLRFWDNEVLAQTESVLERTMMATGEER